MSFVGRVKEINRLLSVIREPQDCALMVVGPSGHGKSALLSQIPRLSGYRTVSVTASSSESEWQFSGLTALLNAMDDPFLSLLAEELPRDAPGTRDVAAVSALLLRTMQRRSAARTIIVIDDADRLDPASQAVIGFLARRLAGTDIALIAAVTECVPDSSLGALPSLALGPLSYDETTQMLEATRPVQGQSMLVHAVAAAAGGNPRAAVDLYSVLMQRQGDGKPALPVPLPCPDSLEAGFALAMAKLTPLARKILELLSLSFRMEASVLERVVPCLWAGVDELLANGLVTHAGPFLRIPDQLLRGYIYAAQGPLQRIANHSAIADHGEPDVHATAWHRSFAGPERQTPFRLLRSATEFARDGDISVAAEYIERALAINPWEAETAARLTALAEHLFARGALVHARRYREWAQRITRNPALILRLTGLDFQIGFAQGAAVRASMVLRLVKEFGHHDRAFAARLLTLASLYYAERWEFEDADRTLQSLDGFRDVASADCLVLAERARLLIRNSIGDTGLRSRQRSDGNPSTASVVMEARALTYGEQYDLAREAFALVKNCRKGNEANWWQTGAFLAIDNEIRAGKIRAAAGLISELEARGSQSTYHRGLWHLFRAWKALALGDETRASSLLEEAHDFSAAENHPAVVALLAAYEGQFALMRGDLAQAFAHLARACELGQGFNNPTLLRCEGDLVEVLVRLGRHGDAANALFRLEARGLGISSAWLSAVVARSRALLADDAKGLQLFIEALDAGHSHHTLFERARTMLCYAERLSAMGRLRDAKNGLLRAKVMFDEVGADAWTRHVDSLLLVERPETAPAPANPAMLLLLDHERALARMVARGMRNKEIAATLYVSVRTVEVRLTAIYRKLGVESRAQLTALATGKDRRKGETYSVPAG